MTATFAEIGINLPAGATGEVKVVCPRCGGMKRTKRENQRDRDLSVNVSEGVWQCWHCDWRGTLKTKNQNAYGSRLKSFERPAPLETPHTRVMEEMYRWFREERGIERSVIERHRIVVAPRAD